MRALTMDEVGFVSGGWDNFSNPVQDCEPAPEGTMIFANGIAVGVSRNADGSINLGVGAGAGISVTNETIKGQTVTINAETKSLPASLRNLLKDIRNGKASATIMIWFGAATDKERQDFWNAAFPR